MKQKKKDVNKFNFDDEYIIGVSAPKVTVDKKKKSSSNKKKSSNKSKGKAKNKPKMNEKKGFIKTHLIQVFLIIALFVGAICFLCLSPAFNIQRIIVEDSEVVPADTISSLSKIQLYKNIFLLDKSSAIKGIEKNPHVESVKISRQLPNNVKISVVERKEKYLIEFIEGKYAVIDGQGYVLSVVNELKQLPILVGMETSADVYVDIKDNSVRLCDEDLRKLDVVSEIVENAKNYEVLDKITKIDIADANNVKLILDAEQKVAYLGSCTDINTRILYLKEIINTEQGKKGEIFINGNLSVSGSVFFRESVN